MKKAEQAAIVSPLVACAQEAEALKAYCETGRTIGPKSTGMFSVTHEKHTELCCTWADSYPTPAQARGAAEDAFNKYAEGRTGTLYWRVIPEIAFDHKRRRYAYYMRLLISDKPVVAS